jgi:hypothetical protein
VRRVDPRAIARLHALGRVAFGAALAAAPARTAVAWVGPAGRKPASTVPTTAMGVRDLAIGLGAVRALGQGFGARPWLWAGTAADVADLVATVRAGRALPRSAVVGVGALAAGSALLGLWAQRAID